MPTVCGSLGALFVVAVAVFLLRPPVAHAQLSIPGVTGSDHSCDWAQLPSLVASLDQYCCLGESLQPASPACQAPGGAHACSMDCASQLVPLHAGGCRPLLNMIFDSEDGVLDGNAHIFDAGYRTCMRTITVPEAIDYIAEKRDQGQCTDADLDDVGETDVGPPPCADTRDRCEAAIADGFMSCAADLCPSCDNNGECDLTCGYCVGPPPPPPPCADQRDNCQAAIDSGFLTCAEDYCTSCGNKAGLCDMTCEFCTPASGGGGDGAGGGGKRQLQNLNVQCDLGTFHERVQEVQDACCDEDNCIAGPPTTCDAKCAVTFNSFFDVCEAILEATVPNSEAYGLLYTTCTAALPLEDLLRAASVCTGYLAPTAGAPPGPQQADGDECDGLTTDAQALLAWRAGLSAVPDGCPVAQWGGDDACGWEGVECGDSGDSGWADAEHPQRVTAVYTDATLFPACGGIVGTLSPCLARLEYLRGLYLYNIPGLSGPVPTEMVDGLPHLNHGLYLQNTAVDGPSCHRLCDSHPQLDSCECP
eukprot:SAG31_NODE_6505_length_1992_cov_2.291601_2_plen_532_part_00